MKRLLRKVNRGVALSLAILLILCCYYAGKAIRMAPEKQEMKQLLGSFYSDFSNAFLVPEAYDREGLEAADVQPLLDDLRETFRPYFQSETDLDYFIKNNITPTILDQTVYRTTQIKSHTCRFQKLTSLSIDYEAETAVAAAKAEHTSDLVHYNITMNENGKQSRIEAYIGSNYNYDCQMTFTFSKTSGSWKITGVSATHWF